jgi:hypothetical protein
MSACGKLQKKEITTTPIKVIRGPAAPTADSIYFCFAFVLFCSTLC